MQKLFLPWVVVCEDLNMPRRYTTHQQKNKGATKMKSNKNNHLGICICLACIAVLLLCGVILFAAHIYKFDPLSVFCVLFQTDANVIWSAINVIVTAWVGIATIVISSKLAKLQVGQSKMDAEQHRLQTEPHILIDSIEISPAICNYTSDRKRIKTIEGVEYPYYVNTLEDHDFSGSSIMTITVVNTSEAFACLSFDKACIKHNNEEPIAQYNISTFGAHKNHIMLRRDGFGKIGLLINNDLLRTLRGTKLTFSTYLRNNFNERFWDEQHYHISDVCEEMVTFMPYDISKNTFMKITPKDNDTKH